MENPMALQVLTGPIIAAGESLSDGIDVSAGTLVRITMPAGWTNANITFQISSYGQGYNDLYDATGREVTMPVILGAAVPLPLELSAVLGFLKIRSGSRKYPIVQPVQ